MLSLDDTVDKIGAADKVGNESAVGEAVTLIVRPEMIQIKRKGGLYPGVVRQAVYLGDVIEYSVEVAGVSVLGVEADPHVTEIFPEGENVTVGFAEDRIQVLPAVKKRD